MKHNTYTQEFKDEIVEKFKKQELGLVSFCKAEHLPISTVSRWVLNDFQQKREKANESACKILKDCSDKLPVTPAIVHARIVTDMKIKELELQIAELVNERDALKSLLKFYMN